jgi:hypothetical protein
MDPPPGHRFIWRRDEYGDKYFVQEKIRDASPEMVQAYVCDEESGRWYKRAVPRADLDLGNSASARSKKPQHKNASTTPT